MSDDIDRITRAVFSDFEPEDTALDRAVDDQLHDDVGQAVEHLIEQGRVRRLEDGSLVTTDTDRDDHPSASARVDSRNRQVALVYCQVIGESATRLPSTKQAQANLILGLRWGLNAQREGLADWLEDRFSRRASQGRFMHNEAERLREENT